MNRQYPLGKNPLVKRIVRPRIRRIPPGLRPSDFDDAGQKALLSVLEASPVPLEYNQIPVDLRERAIQEYTGYEPGVPHGLTGEELSNYWLKRITAAAEMIASTLILNRGLIGRVVTIGTTAVIVAEAQYLRGYIFLNPSASVGLTLATTVLASTAVTAAGNTQSTSIGVANFLSAHFFIDVTAIGATTTLVVILQAFDPLTETWFNAQQLLSTGLTGSFYITAGTVGIVTDMAIRWTVTGGANTATFSVEMVLKDGLPGASATGLTQTIYLGPSGVTTTNGFPLLEGQQKAFFLKEGVQLLGIAEVANLTLRVFEL
jgi:hypothetical protein